jgi:two-component system, chemotaxis family, protein-glutamate methylesterase/glutaminase
MKKILVIGGSAGSFRVVSQLLISLPKDYPWTIIICLHRLKTARTGFKETLSIYTRLRIKEAFDKERIETSTAYLAPANYHLLVEYGHRFCLSTDRGVNHSRPSIDVTMESVAEVFKEKATGILLSGANMDGAHGMEKIHEHGGVTVVQDPKTADIKTMPQAVIDLFKPDHVLNRDGIIKHVNNMNRQN